MATLNRISSGFKPFILTVDTTLTGVTTTGPTQFKLPLTNVPTSSGITPNYRFRVKWGDGNSDKIQVFSSSAATHTYPSGGTYTIKIYGQLDRIYFDYVGDALKVTNVDQWGSVIWKDFSRAFAGCENFTGTTGNDIPRLTEVKDLSEAFSEAINFNYNLSGWNVSNITNLSYTFFNNQSFNQSLNNWNVQNVETMASMLTNAISFNQDIGNWKIDNVIDMSGILLNSGMNTLTYNSLLTGWTGWISGSPTKNVKTGVTFDIGSVSSSGTSAASARLYLINTKSWTINDGDPMVSPSTFISVWDTTLGFFPGTTITLPLVSSGNYNFTVYWGDGSSDTITAYNQPEVSHTYSSNGVKTVYIDGTIDGWSFGSSGADPGKLISILQWGNISLGNDGDNFLGCSNLNLNLVSDVLDLTGTYYLYNTFGVCSSLTNINYVNNWEFSNVTNTSQMFAGTPFNQSLSGWNVSNVTDMSGMFSNSGFNQPIGNWNVSGVTDMTYMFGDSSFDQPLSGWNVSNVTIMNSMFTNSSFNQPIGNWNVSSVSDMSGMFNNSLFNQPLSGWNVLNVIDMTGMFAFSFFNQPIGNWNVSSVTDMSGMFSFSSFNQPIGNWNVSGVTDMTGMFDSLTTIFDINNYNDLLTGWTGWIGGVPTKTVQSNVTFDAPYSNYYLLLDSESARTYLTTTKSWIINDAGGVLLPSVFSSIWDTSLSPPSATLELPLVSSGNYNFTVYWGDGNSDTITVYNQPEVTHVYALDGVYTIYIDGNIEGWSFDSSGANPNKITNIQQWGNLSLGNDGGYFQSCTNLNLNSVTDTLNLYGTTNLSAMFSGCLALSSVNNINGWEVGGVTDLSLMFQSTSFNQPVSGWNVSNVTNMSYLFDNSPFNQPIGNWNVSGVTNMINTFSYSSFNQPLSGWDVSNVTDMIGMFEGNPYFDQPIGNWNVGSVTNMGTMFYGTSFNQPLSGWDVSNVTNMVGMFEGNPYFDQPIGNWNVGSVTDMTSMFYGTSFNQTLSGWNVSSVISMNSMFSNSSFNQPIGNWNVGNVFNMGAVFNNSLFNQPLSGWNVSNVLYMSYMFYSSPFDQPIGNWDVSNVIDMNQMFQGSNFNQPIGNWNVGNVTSMIDMFDSVTLSTSNYDDILTGWTGWNLGSPTKTVQSNVLFDAGNSTYSLSITDVVQSRNYLTGTKLWTITDNGGV